MASHTVRMAAVLVALGVPLSGCQAFVPRDDAPRILPPLAAAPDSGPSAQRRDANGYPIIGAMPKAATTQVSDADVEATRQRFANVGARASGSSNAAYLQRVQEMKGVAAAQQREAAAALAPAPADDAAATSRAQ